MEPIRPERGPGIQQPPFWILPKPVRVAGKFPELVFVRVEPLIYALVADIRCEGLLAGTADGVRAVEVGIVVPGFEMKAGGTVGRMLGDDVWIAGTVADGGFDRVRGNGVFVTVGVCEVRREEEESLQKRETHD